MIVNCKIKIFMQRQIEDFPGMVITRGMFGKKTE